MFGVAVLAGLRTHLFGGMKPSFSSDTGAQRLVGMAGQTLIIGHPVARAVALVTIYREAGELSMRSGHGPGSLSLRRARKNATQSDDSEYTDPLAC